MSGSRISDTGARMNLSMTWVCYGERSCGWAHPAQTPHAYFDSPLLPSPPLLDGSGSDTTLDNWAESGWDLDSLNP